jgi:hypothetical protein
MSGSVASQLLDILGTVRMRDLTPATLSTPRAMS